MRARIAWALVGILWLAWTWPPGRWRTMQLSEVTARIREPARGPLLLVLPGYALPQTFVDDAALEFYRRGFTPVTLDINLAPKPPLAIAELLRELKAPAGIYAHSGSVTPSTQAAGLASNVPGIVLLGFHPGLPRAAPRPRNVLLVFGRFDDYIPLADMLGALADTGGTPPTVPQQQSGQFTDGSARELFLSPLSSHGGEPFDPVIQERASDWLGHCLDFRPDHHRALPCGLRHWAWLALALARPPFWLAVLLLPLSPVGALLLGSAGWWRRRHPGVRAQIQALCLAVLLGVLSYHGFAPDWTTAVGAALFLYLPSQLYGLLSIPRAAGGLALLLALHFIPANDWRERWQRTCAQGWPLLGVLPALLVSSALAATVACFGLLTFRKGAFAGPFAALPAPLSTTPDTVDPAPSAS